MQPGNKHDEMASALPDRGEVFVGGRWVESSGEDWHAVINPSTGRVAGRVRAATTYDIDQAVAAARQSFDAGEWRTRSADQRATAIEEIVRRLELRVGHLVELSALELGNPVRPARQGLKTAMNVMLNVAATAREVPLSEDRVRADGKTSRVLLEPTGVVAAILPWNASLQQVAHKVIPALAAGCSVVLKTPHETPLAGYVVAEVIKELVEEGLIDRGVMSILAGDREVSQHLVQHSDVDHISFTGSTTVGKTIMSAAAQRIARVTLELGGKSAAIILDDADLQDVMRTLPAGALMRSGQACVALTRVLVSRQRHDEVVEALASAISGLTMGDAADDATDLGPLTLERHRERVEEYIALAREEGATVALGGGRPAGLDDGFFVEPTLLTGLGIDSRTAQEEIFGPVIAVIAYEDEDDAVRIANDSIYGLSGAVYTSDVSRGLRIASQVRTGTISINSATFDTTLPFGGYKQSGIGREGGPEGLLEFLEIKTVHLPA